jgi:thiamine transporter
LSAEYSVKLDEDALASFWTLTGMLLFGLALIGGGIVIGFVKKEFLKLYNFIALGAFLVYVIVFISVFPPVQAEVEWLPTVYYYTGNDRAVIIAITIISIIAIAAIPLLLGKKRDVNGKSNTKALTYGALSIALAFALSYVKFWTMPNGGSVTFASLVPIMLYSYMFGIRRGTIVGIIHGLLQFIQGPYILDAFQVILEYPLAFGFIGFTGLFKELHLFKGKLAPVNFFIGAIFAVILRFLMSFFAGAILWADWVPEVNPWVYSLAYNATYSFADLGIALAASALLFSSRNMRRIIDNPTVDAPQAETSGN